MFDTLILPTISTIIPSLFLWIVLSLSLGLCFVYSVFDTLYYLTQKQEWASYALQTARHFKQNLKITGAFLLLFIIPVLFNWQPFWEKVPSPIIISLIAFEGFFVLVSCFLYIILFAKKREISAKRHLVYSWVLTFSLSLTLWIPLAIEAWRECPLGTTVSPTDFTLSLTYISWFLFSPLALAKFFHSMVFCWLAGASCLIAWCCMQALKDKSISKGIATGLSVATLSLFAIICLGDSHGYLVSQQQPLKMASIQNLEKGGRNIPFTIAGPVKIPDMLSRLATHRNNGFVPGIKDVLDGGYNLPEGGKALSVSQKQELASQACIVKEQGISEKTFNYCSQFMGYRNIADKHILLPNPTVLFWTFRIMVGLGIFLFLLLGAQWYLLANKNTPRKKHILQSGLCLLPIVYICSLCGWIIALYGTSPWSVTDLLLSAEAVSPWKTYLYVIETALVALFSLALLSWGIRLHKKILS